MLNLPWELYAMNLRFATGLLVIGTAVLFLGPKAWAHRPIFVDEQPTEPTDALQIPDPDLVGHLCRAGP